MTSTRIGLVVGCLLSCSWSAARTAMAAAPSDDQEEAEPQTKVEKRSCPLGKGRLGSVKIARQPEGCGSGGCGTRTTITVNSADNDRLLTLTNDEGDFTSPGDLDAAVRCRAGLVEIHTTGEPPEISFALRFDPSTGRLRLAGRAPETDGWRRPPLGGPEAALRETRARLLGALLRGGEADDPANRPASADNWVFNQVDGVDRALVDGIWALVARDEIEAGNWNAGETILDRIEERGSGAPAPPSPPVQRRVTELRKLLADTRRRTMPLKVGARRRLGTTLAPQKLPIDPGEAATTFWRRDDLCVIQEETPPRTMRCYTPEAKRWSSPVAIERPANDGHTMKRVEVFGRHVESCEGTYSVTMVLPRDVPDDKANPCLEDGGVNLDAVLAVVDGGKLLRLGGKQGFEVTDGLAPGTDADLKRASELVRQSAGGLLVGEGCCTLDRNANLTRRSGDGPEKTWDLRGAPPVGEAWHGPPLASPDQRWVIAQSAKPGRVTLWLYKLEPAPVVPPSAAAHPPER